MFPLTLLSRAWNKGPAKSTRRGLGRGAYARHRARKLTPAWTEATRSGANPPDSWVAVQFATTTKSSGDKCAR